MLSFRSGLRRTWGIVSRWLQNLWREATTAIAARSGSGDPRGVLGAKPENQLPPLARETLNRIRNGGPFPYPKDGTTFRNLEGSLPRRPKGYYREYTVPPPPGSPTRGTQRLIVGLEGDVYYTVDHYRTFWEVTLEHELP